MAITGDTLITLDTKTSTIELYKLSQITQNKSLQPFQTITVTDAIPLSLTADKSEIHLCVFANQRTYILIYNTKEFVDKQTLKIPAFAFYQSSDYNYTPITSIKVRDNIMLFNQNDQQVEIVKLKKVDVEIYEPQITPQK